MYNASAKIVPRVDKVRGCEMGHHFKNYGLVSNVKERFVCHDASYLCRPIGTQWVLWLIPCQPSLLPRNCAGTIVLDCIDLVAKVDEKIPSSTVPATMLPRLQKISITSSFVRHPRLNCVQSSLNLEVNATPQCHSTLNV